MLKVIDNHFQLESGFIMKQFFPLLGLASFLFLSPTLSIAAESTSQKARPDHYVHTKFETKEQALEGLNTKIKEIDNILSKTGDIEFTDLEAVHEKSYTLEAAVDKLRAEKYADDAKINALDEAVQAIHSASENQELAKSLEWILKLKVAASNISTDSAILPSNASVREKEFFEIVIKDHKFSPAELHVPAGKKIKLVIDNQDPTPEEFESHDFNREKIITGNSKATVFIGPLEAGIYEYFGEFNMDTAKGKIIAE